tara:strand:+ start:131 stop:580 length:450 start_codon:yes stop_codon:yes gene_type:complete
MSYAFSGKIQSAMFVNPPQNSTIELLYGEGTELTAFHLDVNYSSDEFLAFTDEWPLEKIEKTSRDNARKLYAERDNFVADAILADFSPLIFKRLVGYLLDNNSDSEILFDTKMVLLEALGKDAPREQKMKLRKAKTITELFSMYHEHSL